MDIWGLAYVVDKIKAINLQFVSFIGELFDFCKHITAVVHEKIYLMLCKEKISMNAFVWQNSLFHLIQKSIKMKMQLDCVCVIFFFNQESSMSPDSIEVGFQSPFVLTCLWKTIHRILDLSSQWLPESKR